MAAEPTSDYAEDTPSNDSLCQKVEKYLRMLQKESGRRNPCNVTERIAASKTAKAAEAGASCCSEEDDQSETFEKKRKSRSLGATTASDELEPTVKAKKRTRITSKSKIPVSAKASQNDSEEEEGRAESSGARKRDLQSEPSAASKTGKQQRGRRHRREDATDNSDADTNSTTKLGAAHKQAAKSGGEDQPPGAVTEAHSKSQQSRTISVPLPAPMRSTSADAGVAAASNGAATRSTEERKAILLDQFKSALANAVLFDQNTATLTDIACRYVKFCSKTPNLHYFHKLIIELQTAGNAIPKETLSLVEEHQRLMNEESAGCV